MLHRVVITGIGCLTPIGNSYEEVSNSLFSGISGISYCDTLKWYFGKVNLDIDSRFDRLDMQITDKVARGAYLAYLQSVKNSGTKPDGLYLGVSNNSTFEAEKSYKDLFDKDRVRPSTLVTLMMNSAVNFISLREKIKGPAITYSAACSSSSLAIGEAYKAISRGDYKCLAAGGTEFSLTNMMLRCWQSMLAVDKESKPFSKSRKGIVLSEGAVIFIMENLSSALERQATIYAEIVGYGVGCNSETLTKPNLEGQVDVIQKALKDLSLEDITYINAHGTGTPVGDIVELSSISTVFKDLTNNIPISSTKKLHGHLLGASGAMETLSCISVLNRDKVIPNWELEDPDSDIPRDIFLPTQVLYKKQKICMNNTFAFGGTNVSLAFRKYY